MKKLLAILALTLVAAPMFAQDSGWISLWDGKTFNGWKKAGENPDSFRIEDGAIISNGPRCHLFYVGDVHGAKFKNFELEVDVMTTPGSNGGIYVQTAYQETGWPLQGFEIQVNNSHTDWRRTGSNYLVQDVREVPAQDGEWFTEKIVVTGNARAWRHFIELRGSPSAETEIRALAIAVLRALQQEAPNLFDDYRIERSGEIETVVTEFPSV